LVKQNQQIIYSLLLGAGIGIVIHLIFSNKTHYAFAGNDTEMINLTGLQYPKNAGKNSRHPPPVYRQKARITVAPKGWPSG
jgi:hypothetical protein